MKNNKLISIVAIVAAIAIVASTSALFIKHYKDDKNNVITERVTSFQVIGNADSENSDIPTQVVTNKDGVTEVVEVVTDKNGESVTDKQGNAVVKPTESYVYSTNSSTGKSETTTSFISSKPITDNDAFNAAEGFGFAYDSNSGIFYSTSDPWQRAFGYNKYYDKLSSYVGLWYDTVRLEFNYDGYDWLVQFWKGQYGLVLLGAEAGVYYKDENDTSSHYVCTDNSKRLKIGYTCYNKGEVLFERDYQDTWWLTGFVPGRLDKFGDRSQMKMKIRVSLKDAEMTQAFVGALEENGFKQGNAVQSETYYTSGNDVYLMWQTDLA